MGMDKSMDSKKERIRELNHRQKVRFSTSLFPLCLMAAATPVCYVQCAAPPVYYALCK